MQNTRHLGQHKSSCNRRHATPKTNCNRRHAIPKRSCKLRHATPKTTTWMCTPSEVDMTALKGGLSKKGWQPASDSNARWSCHRCRPEPGDIAAADRPTAASIRGQAAPSSPGSVSLQHDSPAVEEGDLRLSHIQDRRSGISTHLQLDCTSSCYTARAPQCYTATATMPLPQCRCHTAAATLPLPQCHCHNAAATMPLPHCHCHNAAVSQDDLQSSYNAPLPCDLSARTHRHFIDHKQAFPSIGCS